MSESPIDLASDDDLVLRIVAGDRTAFTALFHRRQGHVYRFALHMSGRQSLAEDVTQEVFMVVMSGAGRYEPGRSSVTAWLCGIARNFTLRRLDADRGMVPLAEGGDPDGYERTVCPDPVGDLTQADRLAMLRSAVSSLPVRYREVVVLCDLQEMTYADAAAAIGCAVGTVRSRLHRGRALLTAKMHASERRDARMRRRQAAKAGARCWA